MTSPNLSGLRIINGKLVAPDGRVVGRVVNDDSGFSFSFLKKQTDKNK